MSKQSKILTLLLLISLLLPTVQAQDTTDEILRHYDRHWEITDGIYRVMKDGQVGILKDEGTVIVPCEFNQVWNLDDEGYIRVLKNGKAGLYHLNGNIIIPPEYDQIWSFEDGRAKVMKQGKIGYFNKNGEQIIPVEYQQIWSYVDGRARVLKNGKIGYIDEAGNEFIPCAYQQIWAFNDGQARVLKDGKVGYIDETGNEVIPPVFTHIWPFSDGKAKALYEGKLVWIDEVGQILEIPVEDQVPSQADAATVTEQAYSQAEREENTSEKDAKAISVFGNNITVQKDSIDDAIEFGISNDWEERQYKWKRRYEKKQQRWQEKVDRKNNFRNNKFNHKRFKGHFSGVDIGFNSYVTNNGSFSLPNEYNYLDLNQSKSAGVNVNFLQYSIGLQRRGNIGLVTGIGLEFNNYRFDNDILLIKDADGNLSYEPIEADRDVRKNKLTTLYFNIPLLLEFQIPTYRHRSPVYFSAGGIGGVRLKSHTKVVYNENGKKKEKDRSDFNLNPFRYGIMARMGYRAINLYGIYYYSTLFEENKGPELYPVSVGLSVYLDY